MERIVPRRFKNQRWVMGSGENGILEKENTVRWEINDVRWSGKTGSLKHMCFICDEGERP